MISQHMSFKLNSNRIVLSCLVSPHRALHSTKSYYTILIPLISTQLTSPLLISLRTIVSQFITSSLNIHITSLFLTSLFPSFFAHFSYSLPNIQQIFFTFFQAFHKERVDTYVHNVTSDMRYAVCHTVL